MKVTSRHNAAREPQAQVLPHQAAHQPQAEIQSDHALWFAFMQGDESAYAQLYKRNFYELYNYGVKLCSQPDFVKDCIHDLFIDLWKQRKRPRRITTIKPYLLKALRNIIFKEQRRQPRFQPVDLAYNFEIESSSETIMINQQASQQQQQRLYEALSTLTQRQREAVFLRFYSQLSYEEVADVLGISTKATYKLMARAIEILRQKMLPLSLLYVLLSCA